MEPVEINDKRWQLRNGRHRINLIPISEYVIAYYWREEKIGIEICLLWIIDYVSLIIHGISNNLLIAARIKSFVQFFFRNFLSM